MSRNYTIRTRIQRSPEVVFKALVSAEEQSHYFTTNSSADLVEGTEVSWYWEHWGTNPARVLEVRPFERIVLEIDSVEWQKSREDVYPVRVIFELTGLDDGGTMLAISEKGWKTDEDGLRASHENCEGWTHMSVCLKAWLEHDLDLR